MGYHLPMTPQEFSRIIEGIKTPYGTFRTGRDGSKDPSPFWLQFVLKAPDYASVEEPAGDSAWHGRKWRVSAFSTEREVVGTAFAAVHMAVEHEAREGFRYQGAAVFGPHMPIGHLVMGALMEQDARRFVIKGDKAKELHNTLHPPHPRSMKPQTRFVLNYLRKRKLSTFIAVNSLGVASLSSRIAELRRLGFKISDEWKHDFDRQRYKRYRLDPRGQ